MRRPGVLRSTSVGFALEPRSGSGWRGRACIRGRRAAWVDWRLKRGLPRWEGRSGCGGIADPRRVFWELVEDSPG